MKIGLYLPADIPETGGGYTFRKELSQCLEREISNHSNGRHEAVILTLNPSSTLKSKLTRIGNRALKIIGLQGNAKNQLLEEKIDCSDIDLLWFIDSHFYETDLPYILTVFDLQHRVHPWFPEVSAQGVWEWREKFYSHAIQRAFAIICGSEEGKSDVSFFYNTPKSRVHVLHLPTPLVSLKPNLNEKQLNIAKHISGKDYFYYPAQIWPHKNHKMLLSTWEVLKTRMGEDCPHLLFSGSEKGYNSVLTQEINSKGLADVCKYLGFVSSDDVLNLTSNAQAIIFPTLFGPDNIPQLEAMALRTPVLLSELPGCRQMYGDACIYIDPFNSNKMADSIQEFVALPEEKKNQLTDRGYAFASKRTFREYLIGIVRILDAFEPYNNCLR